MLPQGNLPLTLHRRLRLTQRCPWLLRLCCAASHIEYLVTTRSRLPGWSSSEVAARRRFRDFVALAELLKAKFRGYFVPPRPEKNAVEGQRMSDGFVEERRASLQKYLQKLAAHPVIGPSEVCVRAAAFLPHTNTQHAHELCRRRNRSNLRAHT